MTETPTEEPKMGRPNLVEFADTLLELGRADRDVVVVTSDSRGSGKLTRFARELPGQVVEVGVAEQNLVGVAAGLASTGKKVFAVSPACFLTTRALEQIKNDVGYSDNPVTLVGISAGVSYGALGSTHHSLHDVAALRCVHNVDVVVPADNFETRSAVRAAAAYGRPIYLRFGKKSMPDLHPSGAEFRVGRAIAVREGSEVAFVATGETVCRARDAARRLSEEGISAGVLSMHTVKPLDTDALLEAAAATDALITVEEHCVHGGLGEACAAVLMGEGVKTRFRIVGLPDEYTVTGSQEEIFRHYGISPEGLAETARQLLNA
ncbi:MAG: transketolase C-terminal domain-containing protein [Candidatus Brocadiia bacterium]